MALKKVISLCNHETKNMRVVALHCLWNLSAFEENKGNNKQVFRTTGLKSSTDPLDRNFFLASISDLLFRQGCRGRSTANNIASYSKPEEYWTGHFERCFCDIAKRIWIQVQIRYVRHLLAIKQYLINYIGHSNKHQVRIVQEGVVDAVVNVLKTVELLPGIQWRLCLLLANLTMHRKAHIFITILG